jgi:hypothetical protein
LVSVCATYTISFFDAAVGPVVGPVHAALTLVAVATAACAAVTALAHVDPDPDVDAADAATLAGAVGVLAPEAAAALVDADADAVAVPCVLDDEQPARTPITVILTATARSVPGRSRLIEVLLCWGEVAFFVVYRKPMEVAGREA